MRLFLAFKALLFSVLVPGTVAVFIPYSLVSGTNAGLAATNPVLALPGAVCILAGLAVYLRCVRDFAVDGLGTPAPIDPPKTLVVTGLYRRNRNPMYQGVLLIMLGECLLFSGSGLLVYASGIALVFHGLVIFYEEPILTRKFGDSYQAYCRIVPRWGFARIPYSMNDA